MNMGGGGGSGGLFGYYKKYLDYKSTKAQEHAHRVGLESGLNEANNNVKITSEQAPLVPRQAAEDYAARGVGQSTFGAGMGDQWAAKPEPSPQYQTAGGLSVNADSQLPNGQPAPGVAGYRNPINVTPAPDSGMANGEVQPVGTGLQRARDLSNAMVSNAQGSQVAAKDALDQYKKEIKLNRRKFYTDAAEAWVGLIMGMMM